MLLVLGGSVGLSARTAHSDQKKWVIDLISDGKTGKALLDEVEEKLQKAATETETFGAEDIENLGYVFEELGESRREFQVLKGNAQRAKDVMDRAQCRVDHIQRCMCRSRRGFFCRVVPVWPGCRPDSCACARLSRARELARQMTAQYKQARYLRYLEECLLQAYAKDLGPLLVEKRDPATYEPLGADAWKTRVAKTAKDFREVIKQHEEKCKLSGVPEAPEAASKTVMHMHQRFGDAIAAAQSSGKLILCASTKPGCSLCEQFRHETIPALGTKLEQIAVVYVYDITKPEDVLVDKAIRAGLPNAKLMPLVGFLTPRRQWVHGFWGSRSAEQFSADIDAARRVLHDTTAQPGVPSP